MPRGSCPGTVNVVHGSSLPQSAIGCLPQGLIKEKAAEVSAAVFSLSAAAGGDCPHMVHKEGRKKQHRNNPCTWTLKMRSLFEMAMERVMPVSLQPDECINTSRE